jgi:hypothetical protein
VPPAQFRDPARQGAGFARLAAVLVEAVAAIAADCPRGRPLRVLELAATVGPLIGRLVATMAASGCRVVFCAAWDPFGADPPPLEADLILGLGAGARLRAHAALRQAGQLDSLHWAPISLPAPGPGAVLLRIEAAGMTLRRLPDGRFRVSATSAPTANLLADLRKHRTAIAEILRQAELPPPPLGLQGFAARSPATVQVGPY